VQDQQNLTFFSHNYLSNLG